MLLLSVLVFLGIIAFVLFCVIHFSGKSNQKTDDIEQERFIKEHH